MKTKTDNKQHLGYSELTQRVYLGRQNGNHFVGDKRDVTSEFIQIMLQKFSPNTSTGITVDGEKKYKIIVVDRKKKVTVNGKPV